MVGGFLHECYLVQGSPDKIPNWFLDILPGIPRENPIEVAFPSDYSGNDLMNDAFLFVGELIA
jgi:hypothetical protein